MNPNPIVVGRDFPCPQCGRATLSIYDVFSGGAYGHTIKSCRTCDFREPTLDEQFGPELKAPSPPEFLHALRFRTWPEADRLFWQAWRALVRRHSMAWRYYRTQGSSGREKAREQFRDAIACCQTARQLFAERGLR